MTKRLMAALLCAAAMFAIGGVATAQAHGLSYGNAKSLAKKLAEKQVKGRDVLKFEAITRQAQRDLRSNTPATLSALATVKSSSKRCRAVRVPKTAAPGAKALFDIALVEALERPNDNLLNVFSFSLLLADVSNPTLHTGAVAWADYLTTVRALPPGSSTSPGGSASSSARLRSAPP